MKGYNKILNYLTLFIFCGIIFIPLLNSWIKIIPELESHENRTKFERPEFSIEKLDTFTKNFDNYYTDNFSLRENFIWFLHQFEYSVFNISPSPDRVVIGNKGWFYAKKSAANYKGNNLFKPFELQELQEDLKARSEWANKNGVKFYLAVVPNKMNVYPEYLPANILKISEKTRYDQVVELDNKNEINIIDVRAIIREKKKEGTLLYQKTDDHWNGLGAFYGYQTILDRIALDFPQLQAISIDSFQMAEETKIGNIANLVNAAEDNPEQFISLNKKSKTHAKEGVKQGYPVPPGISEWEYEIVKVNENAPDLKCLIIRDSFTLLMIKYFQEHFRKLVLIADDWKYRMREDIIKIEKPDIVITIILETELNKLLEYPFFKTVDYYYNNLKTSNSQFEMIKEKAKKNRISIEKMLMLDALWLFHNTTDLNKQKTLNYYRYLYSTQDSLQTELNDLAAKLNMKMEESIDSCAIRAFSNSINRN